MLTLQNAFIPQQQFLQPGFGAPQFQRSGSTPNKKLSRRRRRRRQVQVQVPTNINPQQQHMFPPQPVILSQNQQMTINQQQQPLPMQQQSFNPLFNPNYYQMPMFPSSAIFQDGQIYPTMDPQFSIQAQISSGPNGNGIYIRLLLVHFPLLKRQVNDPREKGRNAWKDSP